MTQISKTGLIVLLFLFGAVFHPAAQCPVLNSTATLTSSDCIFGPNGCQLCPGDMLTLTPSGTNLTPGSCINWYYGTTPNFNPYNGQGTLLGCSEVSITPPNACSPNPLTLGIFVDACGTEENNEFMVMYSGGGFFVDDLSIDFDASNNGAGSTNDDINLGGSCGWQTPSAFLVSSIQNDCPGTAVIGVGPGGVVPPGVPVMIFTSSETDFDYNFNAACALAPLICILQSNCARTTGAFTNAGTGFRTTTVALTCGWSQTTAYNRATLPGGDGAFVVDGGLPFIIPGNLGCGYPNLFPSLPGNAPNPITVEPLTTTVPSDLCNGGPYWMVGIVEPLPGGCSQAFTNYIPFNVPCPTANLLAGTACEFEPISLVALQDPTVPNGAWSGPGVSGTLFDPAGLSGDIEISFTPTAACGIPSTTTISVVSAPVASFLPPPVICDGGSFNLGISFSGQAPYTFTLTANGTSLGNFTSNDDFFTLPVTLNGSTEYSLENLSDSQCDGLDVSFIVDPEPAPEADLTGGGSVCSGSTVFLNVNFTGNGPFNFGYSINNVPQPPITTTENPYELVVSVASNTQITLTSVQSNGCVGTASGTVNLVPVQPPNATLAPLSLVLCGGQPTDLTVNFTGTGPYTFVYSVNNIPQAPITTSSNPYTLMVNPAVGINTYRVVSVTSGSCSGTASGIATIEVTGSSSAALSGGGNVCNGDSTMLRVDFTGTAPFSFVYAANGISEPAINASQNPYFFKVSPDTVVTYTLVSANTGGCNGAISGQAVVNGQDSLKAVISGGGNVCIGGFGRDLSITFSGGPGPYTFVYSVNDVPQPPITTSNNPYIFNVNPTAGTFYKVVSVTNGTCTGTTSGMEWVFVFTQPTANLLGTQTFCDSANAVLEIDFTGTGPFSFIVVQDNDTMPAIQTMDDPYIFNVQTLVNTSLTLISVETPGCVGAPSGMVEITVNKSPSYVNLQTICNPSAGNYTVTFDIINGTPPYTLWTGSGSFTGSTFTSNPINQSLGYNFAFFDANRCDTVVVAGVSACNCITEAGNMNLSPDTACITGQVSAVLSGGTVLDSDDLLRFILHETPGLPLGNILSWSNNPTFSFPSGGMTGKTYYISAVAGNPGSGNEVDQTDLCFSVSQGTPVVFMPEPSANVISADTLICNGESVNLTVEFQGLPPFSFTPVVNGVSQTPISGINSPVFSWNFTPTSSPTTLVASKIADRFCTGAIGDSSMVINFRPIPAIINPQVICNTIAGEYSVSFEIQGGVSPYTVSGSTGTFTGNQYTSSPFLFGQPYNLIVRDLFNCGIDTLNGLGQCGCQGNAGTMSSVLQTGCEGSSITVPVATGFILGSGEELRYVLHTSSGNTLGTILDWSPTPVFSWQAGLNSGTTYYVSAVVGQPSGNQIDLNSPCLSIAVGTPVQWIKGPTATIDGQFDICAGESQVVTVTLSGTPPFLLTYSLNNQNLSTPVLMNTFNINTTLLESAVVKLVSVSNANNCPGEVSGEATITVHKPLQIDSLKRICNGDGTVTIEFQVLRGTTLAEPIFITGTVPVTYNMATGIYTSNPLPEGANYQFAAFDTLWQCGNDLVEGVTACPCSVNAGQWSNLSPVFLCPGDTLFLPGVINSQIPSGDTLLYVLADGTNPLSWNIVAYSPIPEFGQLPAIQPGTPYYVIAIAGEWIGGSFNFADSCLSISTGPAAIWQEPVSAVMSGVASNCGSGLATIQVDFSGAGPYELIYSDGMDLDTLTTALSALSFQVGFSVPTLFVPVQVTGNGCLGEVSGNAIATVNTPPVAVMALDTTVCVGDSLLIPIQITGTPPFTLQFAFNGTPLPPIPILQNQYNINVFNIQNNQTYTLLAVSDQNCIGMASGNAQIAVQYPGKAWLTGPSEICFGDTVPLTLNLTGLDSAFLTISGDRNYILSPGKNGDTIQVSPASSTSFSIFQLQAPGALCPVDFSGNLQLQVRSIGLNSEISNYNGFPISCLGVSDGRIRLIVSGANPPVTSTWSNGAVGTELDNLPEGAYSVRIMDGLGCLAFDTFYLSAPPSPEFLLRLIPPSCQGFGDGGFEIEGLLGGVQPYSVFIDGEYIPLPDTFPYRKSSLRTGNIDFLLEDANGCTADTTVFLTEPDELLVELGADTTLAYGDSILLFPQTNRPIATWEWRPMLLNSSAPNGQVWIRPFNSQLYTIMVTDSLGCTAMAQKTILLENRRRLYIPNAIAPDSPDGLNQELLVFGGNEVAAIPSLRVYGRWGELLYQGLNLIPNRAGQGWQGTHQGKRVAPGVYVYVVEVEYVDGSRETVSGDITVVR